VLEFFQQRGIHISQSPNGIAVPAGAEVEIATINREILAEDRFDPLRLTVLETAAKYLKSGSIGIALLEGALTPKDAFEAAYVEEIVQRREWGEVEGDHDLNDAETMLWLNGIRLLNNCLVSAKSL
jgi:chaperone required for assembly of F1-ATPase